MALSERALSLLNDKLWRLENIFSVVDRDKKIKVPLKLKPAQLLYWNNQTSDDLVLKARQLGFTTIFQADFLDDAIRIPNLTAVLIAQDDGAAIEFMRRYKDMYDALPDSISLEGQQIDIKPTLDASTEHSMVFGSVGGQRLNSKILVGTAGSIKFGRGQSIDRALCTEVAFWPPETAEAVIAAIEGAMPPIGGKIRRESTANGTMGYFYDFVEKTKRGSTGAKLHVMPWWLDPAYRIMKNDPRAKELGIVDIIPTEEEARLMLAHRLDLDQIRFRRFKFLKLSELTWQEMLEDDITCFLLTGTGVFSRDTVQYYSTKPKDPIIQEDGLRIWLPPAPMDRYIVAADVSGGQSDDADYDAAVVVNTRTLEHVATLHGRFHAKDYAERLVNLATRYNEAVLAVEVPGPGQAILEIIEHFMGYGNLYRRETGELGWANSWQSKPVMVSELKTALNSHLLITYDSLLVGEIRGYMEKVRGGKVTYAAGSGYDDVISAMGCALMVRWFQPDASGTQIFDYSRFR